MVVTDMVGDIGTGVVVVVYWTRDVGGVHSIACSASKLGSLVSV